jgi:hypothetical protein
MTDDLITRLKEASCGYETEPGNIDFDGFLVAAIRIIRAEALEEAAKNIEVILPNTNREFAAGKRWCAAQIRALKDKPANQTDGGE